MSGRPHFSHGWLDNTPPEKANVAHMGTCRCSRMRHPARNAKRARFVRGCSVRAWPFLGMHKAAPRKGLLHLHRGRANVLQVLTKPIIGPGPYGRFVFLLSVVAVPLKKKESVSACRRFAPVFTQHEVVILAGPNVVLVSGLFDIDEHWRGSTGTAAYLVQCGRIPATAGSMWSRLATMTRVATATASRYQGCIVATPEGLVWLWRKFFCYCVEIFFFFFCSCCTLEVPRHSLAIA